MITKYSEGRPEENPAAPWVFLVTGFETGPKGRI